MSDFHSGIELKLDQLVEQPQTLNALFIFKQGFSIDIASTTTFPIHFLLVLEAGERKVWNTQDNQLQINKSNPKATEMLQALNPTRLLKFVV